MRNLLVALPLLSACSALGESAEPAQPTLKVFLLAGQSNMEGQAVVDLDHPDLRTCLTTGLTGATFPARPLERPLAVRVPLFFRDGRPVGPR